MKTRLFLLLIIFCSLVSRAQNYDSAYGKPIVVFIETDPWLMVIGSDVPQFTLYENGQVIYKKVENREIKIYQATISKDEIPALLKSLHITGELAKLPNNIEASSWTDQPSNVLLINTDSAKNINVYGYLSSKEAREKTPNAFLRVYDAIKNYNNDDAEEWLPGKIEVMFWDYSYAPAKRPWIKGLPDLNSRSTIQRGDMYSVYIDKKDFDEFLRYYRSMKEKQAVEINGKKMAMSYRLQFPNLR